MPLVHEVKNWLKKKYHLIFFLSLGIFLVYWQSKSIYGGDSGDLVSAACVFGIPHPPGYPLYTLLSWLLIKIIPVFTVAWRVTLLSSLPMVFTSFLIYKILQNLTKKNHYSLFGSFIYSFVYPVYLYSQVPEVFSLYLLFLTILIYLSLIYRQTHKRKYLCFFSFVFGLSLTHHHLIIFSFPAILFLLFFKNPKAKSALRFKTLAKLALLFLIPFLIYSYVFFAASLNPPLNWENPINFQNFKRLITRESYGTFTSTRTATYQTTFPRLLDVFVLFHFIYDDFGLFGLFLIPFGFFYLFKKNKTLFYFTAISFFTYLFFIFYAAFPLHLDFNVATYERFITTPYLILVFVIVFGMVFVSQNLFKMTQYFTNSFLKKVLIFSVKFSFFLYTVSFLVVNFPKISILKNDKTAENLAYDILSPLEKNSILILADDTPLFNTQYVYYAQNIRNDVILIHHSKLYAPYYQKTLKKYYPKLKLNKNNKPFAHASEFIALNYKKFPIYLNRKIQLKKGALYPIGLLYKYYPDKKPPPPKKIKQKSQSFWKKYHHPLKGSLKVYKNLMLADVLRVYATHHTANALFYLDNNFLDSASKHLLKAITYQPQEADNYYYLGKIYLQQKKCSSSLKYLKKANNLNPNHLDTYFLLKEVYANCLNDQKKANFYKNLYLKKKQTQEGLIEKL